MLDNRSPRLVQQEVVVRGRPVSDAWELTLHQRVRRAVAGGSAETVRCLAEAFPESLPQADPRRNELVELDEVPRRPRRKKKSRDARRNRSEDEYAPPPAM